MTTYHSFAEGKKADEALSDHDSDQEVALLEKKQKQCNIIIVCLMIVIMMVLLPLTLLLSSPSNDHLSYLLLAVLCPLFALNVGVTLKALNIICGDGCILDAETDEFKANKAQKWLLYVIIASLIPLVLSILILDTANASFMNKYIKIISVSILVINAFIVQVVVCVCISGNNNNDSTNNSDTNDDTSQENEKSVVL